MIAIGGIAWNAFGAVQFAGPWPKEEFELATDRLPDDPDPRILQATEDPDPGLPGERAPSLDGSRKEWSPMSPEQ